MVTGALKLGGVHPGLAWEAGRKWASCPLTVRKKVLTRRRTWPFCFRCSPNKDNALLRPLQSRRW